MKRKMSRTRFTSLSSSASIDDDSDSKCDRKRDFVATDSGAFLLQTNH